MLMRRRDFITLFSGAATAWPLAARAQQPALPVIGFLHQGASDSSTILSRVAAFRQGLREAGYAEGQNIIIEYRAADRTDRLPNLAAELVALNVRVIVAAGSEAVFAAQRATRSIHIVM